MADTEERTTQSGDSGDAGEGHHNNNNNNSETDTLITKHSEHAEGTKVEDKTALIQDQTASNSIHGQEADIVQESTKSPSVQLQLITDRALHFLSHASNETIGACLVGLGATTYLVLGRVGLVLIGLVGGIALHASWDANGESDRAAAREKELRKKRELGLEVVQRVFQWKSEKSATDDESDNEEQDLTVLVKRRLDFSAFRPDTAAALTAFTDAILRDYVKWWYAPILPGEESFPQACRQTLTAFIISLSHRLSRKRPVDAFLDFVTNSTSIIIVFLNELSAALNASPNTPATDAVATYLEIKPDSSLANILDTRHQDKKLALVADDILKCYLDKKTYECLPVQIFLRQVLGKLVLSMTIDTCSKPEWINGWIVYLLDGDEPELLNAIDAGVERSTNSTLKSAERHASIAESTMSPIKETESVTNHKRNRSRAEDAMDEAMKEARRLTMLIVEEEAKREKESKTLHNSHESISESTTEGIATPASSQSDSGKNDANEVRPSSRELSPTSTRLVETIPSRTHQPCTSFDQMVPGQATALTSEVEKNRLKPISVLTLFNAKISIFDDSLPGEKNVLKSKPIAEYMIQIEPSDSKFPGWMIVRKYADFETLHEVLRRISAITGVGFSEAHPDLPTWKMHTKASLRGELERYLCDAVSHQALAESEGMKRFLEKDQGLSRSPGGTKGFGWPTPVVFDQMGKSMLDVLTKAPKEVAGGGKAFFGGVAGVLGGRKAPGHAPTPSQSTNRSSISLSQNYMEDSYMGSLGFDNAPRESSESIRSLTSTQRKASAIPSTPQQDNKPKLSTSSRSSVYGRQSTELRRTVSRSSSVAGLQSPRTPIDEELHLPPLPSEITEDYMSPKRQASVIEQEQPSRRGEDMSYSNPASRRASTQSLLPPSDILETPSRPVSRGKSRSPVPPLAKTAKPKPPITEQETQVAVELIFAVITELYTLSSAWQIRRTLLNAAKTFLLRPGNPQLEAIRILFQESVIDANTSDSGIASHINTIRASSLPTEEEAKKFPKELNDQAKEELRVKARKLLVEKGMPVALTGVMGQAATGEALGRVFDCLQDYRVARGLMFGLMLQGLRGIVQ